MRDFRLGMWVAMLCYFTTATALKIFTETGSIRHEEGRIPWTPDKSWSPYEWLRERESKVRPALYHMHIPKVAGISFIRDVLNFLPNSTGLYSAEACYQKYVKRKGLGIPREGPHWDGIVTMLRNPRDHVYSQYVECADDTWGEKAVKDEQKHLLKNFPTWLRHFSLNFTTDDLGCYHPFNMQTRAFLCEGHLHHVNSEEELRHVSDIKLAVQRMSETFFVGLAEQYQESMCVLRTKVTGALPEWCNCEDPLSWSKFVPQHESHKTRAHSVSELSPADLRMVDQLTLLDRQLYIEAQRRFLRDVQDVEEAFNTRILC